jgi:ABC-type polysaccharide/polyol phosphate export permease
MTGNQIRAAVIANVVFWGFLGLVVVTNGWALFGAIVLLIVFLVSAAGVGAAS